MYVGVLWSDNSAYYTGISALTEEWNKMMLAYINHEEMVEQEILVRNMVVLK